MDKSEYLSAISKQRKIQATLNNIYIWSKMAVLSLEEIEKNRDVLDEQSSFPVPSKLPNKEVRRNVDAIVDTLTKARTTDIYKALVVYVVSLVEPVLMEIVRLTLLYDKRRVKTKPKGSDGRLEYDTILNCNDYAEVMNVIIAKYIDVLNYSKPIDQIEYIQKLLSIEIEESLWKDWIEIKASRDLIVHNSCNINKIYLDKVGDKARGELGSQIVIDEEYYKKIIVVSKSLIGQIVSKLTKKEKTNQPTNIS